MCNMEESMEHILTKCEATSQNEIWTLANKLWKQKTKSELTITKGVIMACGIPTPESHRNAAKQATERFQLILISESAHLIWKIRNDHVINEKAQYTAREVEL
ncbi:hypothetical protein IW261DRAFT_1413646 [Armillaria novae-zelandiae]|uniref:Uncharacterized protein n=1 Tax=Armillaria novae-zelandiae TaxID=153914 RepID=A0AA39PW88_9AGAR|nr:hypothetical protein IW261DRAFT_1413646 [Armillaria novae-zelandiae]